MTHGVDFEKLGSSVVALARSEALTRALQVRTRGLLRPALAHWELAEMMSLCVPLALHDVLHGDDFPQMRARWLLDFGVEVEPHLPSVFLAAAASTAVDCSYRQALIGSVELYDD